MKTFNRPCPICNCKKGEILHHQKFKFSDECILPAYYDFVSCLNCGFVFADSIINQSTYSTYYSDFSKYEEANSEVSSGGGTSPWDKSRIENTVNDIARYCSTEDSVLDIGCANGGILSELKMKGYMHLLGLEPSEVCVKYVNRQGIKCSYGELFEAKEQLLHQKFDMIILSHVMEHIYDVRKALTILKSLLNENGLIYIEVPDAANYSKHYIVPYYYFDSEHINHFDKHSLINLFCSTGFDLVITENKSFYVNDNAKYPAVYGVFTKASKEQSFSISKDETVIDEIKKYIDLSRTNSSNTEIEELIKTNEPIVIFGAGNFTARLLETTCLKKCNIISIVDNDKKKQQTTFNNKLVASPDFIKNFSGTIVVCSALFYEQIVHQLQMVMGINNKIVVIK